MTDTLIRIGIYGNTAAGKTRFIYEVFRQLQEFGGSAGKVKLNLNAQIFFDEIDTKMKITRQAELPGIPLHILEMGIITKGQLAEIETKNQELSAQVPSQVNFSTNQRIDDIRLSIRNDYFVFNCRSDGTPSAGEKLLDTKDWNDFIDVEFFDEMGETLFDLVGNAGAKPDKAAKLDEILRNVDYLLFFFDPTSSDKERSDAVWKHYQDGEIRNAGTIAEHLLKVYAAKQPEDIPPILFVLTHKDVADEKCSMRAESFNSAVCKAVKDKYIAHFGERGGKLRFVSENVYEGNYFFINSADMYDTTQVAKRISVLAKNKESKNGGEPSFWEWVWEQILEILKKFGIDKREK
jgi:hypothetical protein